jgi:hypothetical protein
MLPGKLVLVLSVVVFIELVWTTMKYPGPLDVAVYVTTVKAYEL